MIKVRRFADGDDVGRIGCTADSDNTMYDLKYIATDSLVPQSGRGTKEDESSALDVKHLGFIPSVVTISCQDATKLTDEAILK